MNYEEIQKLIETMGNSKLDTLSIEFPDGVKINMKKREEGSSAVVNTKKEPEVTKTQEEKDETIQCITSPMVGTFYTKASPKEKEFVKVGDVVKKGQVLCIIEAMKLMNEVESEYDGEIVEICSKNEEMVDFGKPLFKIKVR